ncbi:MAG: lipopolysaccharide heptosyltransferase II [Candidatus Aminicenantes bacterium]|nr:lipopolysaccharide heptosyltransferase II [Candidatus Aminicenantes bacterium]
MKLLVRTPNWIGDAVMSLPVLDCLHENLPDGEIWVAATPWVRDVFASLPYLGGTVCLPEGNGLRNLRLSAKTIEEHRFDIGVLLTNSFASALLFYLAKIPERWGYAKDGRHLLLTKGITEKLHEKSSHQLHSYLTLVSKLGMETPPVRLNYPLAPHDKERAREFLVSSNVDTSKPIVILSPGASYGPAKRWPTQNFGRLAVLLQDKIGAEILIVGSQQDGELGESIAAGMNKKPVLLAGKTSLNQLAGIVSHAALFVSNDSGLMHLANALHRPVIAIFGPTDPGRTGPYQEPSLVLKKEAPCWPCFYRACPYEHQCMTSITPEEACEACLKLI